MKRLNALFGSIFCLFLLVGCENPVNSMKDTAEEAADNSGLAADAASESREEIATGRIITRMSASSESRDRNFNQMLQSHSFEAKVLSAGKWMKALEYQHWTGQRYDDETILKAMYDEAISEFFYRLTELNGGESIAKNQIDAFGVLTGSRMNPNIAAMAVALHKKASTNEFTNMQRIDGHEPKSFYDILIIGLQEIQKVEDGDNAFGDLDTWQQNLYSWRAEAITIMNYRFNQFLLMGASKSLALREKSAEEIGGMLQSTEAVITGFPELGLGVQHKVNDFLKASLQVKMHLMSIKQQVSSDPLLKGLYMRMTMPAELNARENPISMLHQGLIDRIFPD